MRAKEPKKARKPTRAKKPPQAKAPRKPARAASQHAWYTAVLGTVVTLIVIPFFREKPESPHTTRDVFFAIDSADPSEAPNPSQSGQELSRQEPPERTPERLQPAPDRPPEPGRAAEPDRELPPLPPQMAAPQMRPMETPPGLPFYQWDRATGDWSGRRTRLEEAGIAVNAQIVADESKVFHGGASPGGTAFRDLFQFNLTIDTGKLLGLRGGTFFVNFQNEAGDNGSRDAGDLQGFDGIDADGRTQLAELWYEQELFDGSVRVRVGKTDANTVFALPQNGGEFIHTFGGSSPNIILPRYPDPATGALAVWTPGERFFLGGGVFDGTGVAGFQGLPTDAVRTGSYGPAHLFGHPPTDLSLIAEGGIKWGTASGGLPGRLALGAWHNASDFPRCDGGVERGTSGYYVVVDHTFWKASPSDAKDKRAVAGFVEYAYADPRVMAIWQHVGGGLAWTGPVPGRNDDVAGIGASYALFSESAGLEGAGELAVELFYKVQVTPYLSIKPDLQYIHNPGGVPGQNDALVGTVRLQVDF